MAAAAIATVALAGCGVERSSCVTPLSDPVTLSAPDRRDPALASNGGARAIAVWESLSGGPVEATMRGPTGRWGPVEELSAPAARDPVVAMDPEGSAVAVWERQPVGGVETVEATNRTPVGEWTAPVAVSPPGAPAREPQVGVDGRGVAIAAWRTDAGGGAIAVSVRPPGGAWGAARTVAAPGVPVRRPRLAVAPDGFAAVVWEEERDRGVSVAAATRGSDGSWSTPTRISGSIRNALEPAVAVGLTGQATVVWLGSDAGRTRAFVADLIGPGSWSEPRGLGPTGSRPREVPRPGRADTAAAVTVLPDGSLLVAWTLFDGDGDRVIVASRREATWTEPKALSTGTAAGGVQVASGAGGAGLVGWEEVDGGLLRARVRSVDSAGAGGACTDVAAGRRETGGVRLAGGSAPLVGFVDLNRTRVAVAEVP